MPGFGLGNSLSPHRQLVPRVSTLPASGLYTGQRVLFYKYPKVASLPGSVTNGMRYVLTGSPDQEYYGVGGVWTVQTVINWNYWKWTGSAWAYDYGANLQADLDFADGIAGWEGQYTDADNFSIVTHEGKTAGKFSLASGELWTNPDTGGQTARSELQLWKSGQHGATVDYEWDFFIPSDFPETALFNILGQFHDQPDPTTGDTCGSYPSHPPCVSMQYKQGNFQIVVVTNFGTNAVSAIISVPITKGAWHNFKCRAFWSTTASGTFTAKLDDIQLTASGQSVYIARNCYNVAGNYLKIGLYSDPSNNTARTVYFANVKSTLISQA